MNAVFLEPLDVLYLRGNRSFGAPGDHAAAQMPPWPSLVAGALRSRMLADAAVPLEAVRDGGLNGALGAILGSVEEPGSFRLASLALARESPAGALEVFHPCPADLFIAKGGGATYLRPVESALAWSNKTAQIPALNLAEPGKPEPRWLNPAAWKAYLDGTPIATDDLVEQRCLWSTDPRVGVGLDPEARAAAKGKLVSTDTVALRPGVGLWAGVAGAEGHLPGSGQVRLGGDGRAAVVSSAPAPIARDFACLAPTSRLRLILTAPAIFTGGSLLPEPLRRRVVAAAVPRHQIISGWDLARWRPKPALRVVPAGAVYWLEGLECSADQLSEWETQGLWDLPLETFKTRKPEGFNAVVFAPWAPTS